MALKSVVWFPVCFLLSFTFDWSGYALPSRAKMAACSGHVKILAVTDLDADFDGEPIDSMFKRAGTELKKQIPDQTTYALRKRLSRWIRKESAEVAKLTAELGGASASDQSASAKERESLSERQKILKDAEAANEKLKTMLSPLFNMSVAEDEEVLLERGKTATGGLLIATATKLSFIENVARLRLEDLARDYQRETEAGPKKNMGQALVKAREHVKRLQEALAEMRTRIQGEQLSFVVPVNESGE